MTENLTVSMVIITYKRPDELQKAIENVLALNPLPDEIIVFDDDPEGSGANAPLTRHPSVRYICLKENFGVAGARNRAAFAANSDILLFMDDDATFAERNVINVVRQLFQDEKIAVTAFLIRNATTKSILPKNFPGYDMRKWPEKHYVTYFVGCGFALRRQVFADFGGFDQVLYYGEEELDFSLRIINAGWQLIYTPEVVVYHNVSPHGRENIKRTYRLIRNRIYIAAKHMPFPYWLTHVVIWGGAAFIWAIRAGQPGEFFRGVRSVWTDGLMKKALEYRRKNPMNRNALAYLKKHKGRLIY